MPLHCLSGCSNEVERETIFFKFQEFPALNGPFCCIDNEIHIWLSYFFLEKELKWVMIIRRLLLTSWWNSSFFENWVITGLGRSGTRLQRTQWAWVLFLSWFCSDTAWCTFHFALHTAISHRPHYFFPKLQKNQYLKKYLKERLSYYFISVFVRFIVSIANSFNHLPAGYMQGTFLCRITCK